MPKIFVATTPILVGVPVGVSNTPTRLRSVWILSKAELRGDGGR